MMSSPPSPRRAARAIVACAVACIAAAYVVRLAHVMPWYGTDLDPIRAGARIAIHGGDPYDLIGPGRAVPWNFRLLYPGPALVVALPLVALPIVAARAVFVFVLSAALAYGMTRRAWWPLFVFASASWWDAVGLAQWSPGLLAACSLPWLGFIVAAKPNVGLAVIAGARSRRDLIVMVAGILLLTAASFALAPHWLAGWSTAIRDAPHIRPLILEWRYGGPLLLLAALWWRDPRARLLFTLAIVPMNPALYEGVLLFAIPSRAIQAAILALASWFVTPLTAEWLRPGAAYLEATRASAHAMLVLMFLPALISVAIHAHERSRAMK